MRAASLKPAQSVERILKEKGELVIPKSTAQVSPELQGLEAVGKIVMQEAASRRDIKYVKIVLAA